MKTILIFAMAMSLLGFFAGNASILNDLPRYCNELGGE